MTTTRRHKNNATTVQLIDELKCLGTRLALPRMQQRAVQIARDQLDSFKTHVLPPKHLINSETDSEWLPPPKVRLAYMRAYLRALFTIVKSGAMLTTTSAALDAKRRLASSSRVTTESRTPSIPRSMRPKIGCTGVYMRTV